MAYLDRNRAQALMSEANLDALILLSPESFYYATGAVAGVATMWRTAGAVAVLIPADAGRQETAIVSDLFAGNFRQHSHITDIRESAIWVETATVENINSELSGVEMIGVAWRDRPAGFERPATFDSTVCYQHLLDALTENGLANSRIGYEASAVSAADFPRLQQWLSGIELIDASDMIMRLKMVKSPREIANLRQAVNLAELGIAAVRDAITSGVSREELATTWRTAINAHQQDIQLTGAWEYISVGTDPWGGNATVSAGGLIKVDVGCLVDGYTSDTGRTFVLEKANDSTRHIFDALLAGFEAGAAKIAPGVLMSEVHSVTQSAIRSCGYTGYTRGHFGHGLGASVGSEQWPFFSANSSVELEAGMVLAFECPWYINGVGGMIVENQLLITENGHEIMNTLPYELVEVSDS